MQDETTIQHTELATETGRVTQSKSVAPRTPSLAELAGRPENRYVPSAVRWANCDRPGSTFEWFQRIPEDDVDGERPTEPRHLCSIFCLGAYAAQHYPSYSPTTEPVHPTWTEERE